MKIPLISPNNNWVSSVKAKFLVSWAEISRILRLTGKK